MVKARKGPVNFKSRPRAVSACRPLGAYLRPAMKRKNLTVVTEAEVSKVLFEGKKAVGVEYERRGKTEQVGTAREVIVSGGSINSPKLLQLSGIGPA